MDVTIVWEITLWFQAYQCKIFVIIIIVYEINLVVSIIPMLNMCNIYHSLWNKCCGCKAFQCKICVIFTIVYEISLVVSIIPIQIYVTFTIVCETNVVVAKRFNVKYVSCLP
jgi:hypothetical protein